MNSTTPIFHDLDVVLRPCLCGVQPMYASAQALERLDILKTGRCEVSDE